LSGIALIERFGLVYLGDEVSPVGKYFLIGFEELDIGVAVFVVEGPRPCGASSYRIYDIVPVARSVKQNKNWPASLWACERA
jgi:hypothetical protein